MIIERVEPDEFRNFFPLGCSHLYNSAEFSELNAQRCEELHFLLFRDSKVRLGFTAGVRDGGLFSPFSAPFGGFCSNSRQSVECVDEAVGLLAAYGSACDGDIRITLPPPIYSSDLDVKTSGALFRAGHLECADLNYHYDIAKFDDFESNMASRARNKFRESMRHDFMVRWSGIGDVDLARRCYEVIAANRRWKGYPLRMSFGQVAATAVVARSVFVVMSLGDDDVAAALIQMVAPGVGQLVYWGDVPGFSDVRPMNRLAFETFAICREKGLRVLDLGPSSEGGVPSYGLCGFKESIGCDVSLKHTFRLRSVK